MDESYFGARRIKGKKGAVLLGFEFYFSLLKPLSSIPLN